MREFSMQWILFAFLHFPMVFATENYNYLSMLNKLDMSGALERISRKWMKKGKPLNCNSKNSIEPLTLNKIGSLIVLLIMGMIFAIVAFIIEVCMDQMQTTKKCKETTAIIELRESFLDKPLQKFHPFSLTDGGLFKACQRQLMKGSASSDNISIVELNRSKIITET